MPFTLQRSQPSRSVPFLISCQMDHMWASSELPSSMFHLHVRKACSSGNNECTELLHFKTKATATSLQNEFMSSFQIHFISALQLCVYFSRDPYAHCPERSTDHSSKCSYSLRQIDDFEYHTKQYLQS